MALFDFGKKKEEKKLLLVLAVVAVLRTKQITL